MKIIHHLFFKSFLATQPENFTIDVLIENCDNSDVFFSAYTEKEMKRINVMPMNWDNIIDPKLVFHDFDSLKNDNLALLSDYCRILTLIKTPKHYYTFYFDLDIVFLKSFEFFLNNKGFVYSWGNSESGNSAIIKTDANTGEELKRLLELNKTPYPQRIFKSQNEKINVLSCTIFDPQWFTNEYSLPFANDDSCRCKMNNYVEKYESYSVHWHNRWNVNPMTLPKSWMYSMYKKFVNIDTNVIMDLENKFPICTDILNKVQNCTYGDDDHNVDVIYTFCSVFAKNGKIIINKKTSFNLIFGDHVYGKIKRLQFTLNGTVYTLGEHKREDIDLTI